MKLSEQEKNGKNEKNEKNEKNGVGSNLKEMVLEKDKNVWFVSTLLWFIYKYMNKEILECNYYLFNIINI